MLEVMHRVSYPGNDYILRDGYIVGQITWGMIAQCLLVAWIALCTSIVP